MNNAQITIQKSTMRLYFIIPSLLLGLVVTVVSLLQAASGGPQAGLWFGIVILGLFILLTSLWSIGRLPGQLTINGTVLSEWSTWAFWWRRADSIDLARISRVGGAIPFGDYKHIIKMNGWRGAGALALWDDSGKVYALDLSFYRSADRLKLMSVLTEALLRPGVQVNIASLKGTFYGWFGGQATDSISWPNQDKPTQ